MLLWQLHNGTPFSRVDKRDRVYVKLSGGFGRPCWVETPEKTQIQMSAKAEVVPAPAEEGRIESNA